MCKMNRRTFLAASAGTLLAGPLPTTPTEAEAQEGRQVRHDRRRARRVQEKFELIKKLGFEGVEIDSPERPEPRGGERGARRRPASRSTASSTRSTGDDTLSHPDEKVRAKGLEPCSGRSKDAKTVGADTVLLVPGRRCNKDVTYEQCWERSQAEVKKALPLAEKAEVKIAIEVVWNNFITKPEQLVEYVDDSRARGSGRTSTART